MSRGVKVSSKSREVVRDPIYGSKILTKLVNCVMCDGKKSVAQRIVYGAIDDVSGKILTLFTEHNENEENATDEQKVIWFLEYIINKIAMMTEIRSRRMGGSNYRIPFTVSVRRAVSVAIRRIVLGAQNRKERTMRKRLAAELIAIIGGTGEVLKMLETLRKDIDANRAFAHYANK
ncbi:MAG: 30S ribosomal protein S7 [Alphaproteobacteria bacterium]|nr:30S ribosomal protein S7 [Rickettsiales bacterium]